MARGYEGAFGRKWNSPWLLIPLGLLFLLPFVDFRRPLRLLHLDLLVLLGFGVSHVFFNRGEIGVSVPLAYPVLLYVLGRMLWEGWRRRERVGRARAARAGQPAPCGARLPRRLPDRAERDRLERDRRRLLGRDRRRPDRGRRRAVRRRVRARQQERERLRAGRLPRVRAVGAAVALGRHLGRPAGGPCRGDHVRPADHRSASTCSGFACAGRRSGSRSPTPGSPTPTRLFALETNTNDTLVAALLVWALVAVSAPVVRGALIGLASAAKFAALGARPALRRARPAAAVRRGVRGRRRGRRASVPAGRRAARLLRHDARLPRRARVAVQRLGPGARARLAPHGREGRRRRPRAWRSRSCRAGATPSRWRRSARRCSIALQLVTVHWFYLYVVWFTPFVLVALFAAQRSRPEPVSA